MPSVKEYRIPMPLSLEEYRIAQLYMIQKKSQQESTGEGSGVEILKNEPYDNGPGGSGQYTEKLYHVQSHLPQWVSAFLSKGAFVVKECAWNAYPYTKTKFTISSFEKFSISIETRFLSDAGTTENVFNLEKDKLKEYDYFNNIDHIDMCAERAAVYNELEDPLLYKSESTGRGPLPVDWLERSRNGEFESKQSVMCSYKLCNVEFRYWGIQKRMENFILDFALRRTMLKAHQQAWAWQDEWINLTIEDIRRLEREAQEKLRQKYHAKSTVTISPEHTGDQSPVNEDDPPPNYEDIENANESHTELQLPSVEESDGKDSEDSDDDFFDCRETLSLRSRTASIPSVESDGVFEEVCHKNEIAALLIVVHSGKTMGFQSNYKDDLAVFESTLNETLKLNFPLASSEIIKTHAIEFNIPDNNLKEMMSKCSLKESSGSIGSVLIPIILSQTKEWETALENLKNEIDSIHYQYLSSNPRFNAPIYLIGDVLGGIAAYDFLLNENRMDRKASTISTPVLYHKNFKQTIVRRSFESTATECDDLIGGIEINGLFLFNCPLAYYIMMKKAKKDSELKIPAAIFNIFYPMDSSASRIEPLLLPDQCPPAPVALTRHDLWSSECRMDYALPCPDRLRRVLAAPQLLYSACWESTDITSLILKEAIYNSIGNYSSFESTPSSNDNRKKPWRKRRTTLKVRNLDSNHRSQDLITLADQAVELIGRFVYGPFDFTCLSGETVELSICNDLNEGGNWKVINRGDTDSNGKINFNLDKELTSSVGIYKLRLTVLGDKTESYSKLIVTPPKSKCVVFSIDGSFAASVSILGTDPRVRAAAVDVVRYWSDAGYLIIYISSRPDMQKNRVGQWLKQHNFPQGVTFFQKGIYHDPYSRKGTMLKNLVNNCELVVEAVYGSARDVSIYQSLRLDPAKIFIISKPSRRLASKCKVLSAGYSAHLEQLRAGDQLLKSPSNTVNPRLFFRQQSFSH